MIRSTLLLVTVPLFAATVSRGQTTRPAAPATTRPADADTHVGDASYGIGFGMGRQLAGAPVKLDVERVVASLRDAAGGKPSAVPEARVRAAVEAVQADAAAGAEDKARQAGDAAVKAGDAYRAANGQRPGVTTTPSGLQIETLTAGTGESPKPTDTVKVHYVGTLVDGTKFDSSLDRGEPITFPLNGVIKG